MIAEQLPTGGNDVGSLIVFSDDWGRHPSSCQHLVRNLIDRYPVLWVNTIGTRAPRLDAQTLKRVTEKIRQWRFGKARIPQPTGDSSPQQYSQPIVVNPKMWPWFESSADRRLNRWLLSMQLEPLIQKLPRPVVGVTTLPITADLPGVLSVDRWLYYCVDDFSQWPGLDGETLRRMDRDMIRRADSIVAVSEHLQRMIAEENRPSSLLTHGVDFEFWKSPVLPETQCHSDKTAAARVVFWGVIDRRMDTPTLRQLSLDLPEVEIILVGPQQDPDPSILSLPNVQTLPPQPISALPAIAQSADVLIMPYADLPVTRAMQPLKLKEYLATGKPVVVNRLPSTDTWSDCLDVAETPRHFSHLVRDRITTGTPSAQAAARSRLILESWQSKAQEFHSILSGQHAICTGDGR